LQCSWALSSARPHPQRGRRFSESDGGIRARSECIDRVWSDPSVDEPAVVANLESAAALERLHKVKILVGANLAEDDTTNFQHYPLRPGSPCRVGQIQFGLSSIDREVGKTPTGRIEAFRYSEPPSPLSRGSHALAHAEYSEIEQLSVAGEGQPRSSFRDYSCKFLIFRMVAGA